MITTILLSMNTLDLKLAMPMACVLSEISSQSVRIRVEHLRKDCMPSGREAMLKLLQVWLFDMSRPRICIPTSDAAAGSIGEGVDEILNMRGRKRSHSRVYIFD